jgi:hypothetical protein
MEAKGSLSPVPEGLAELVPLRAGELLAARGQVAVWQELSLLHLSVGQIKIEN